MPTLLILFRIVLSAVLSGLIGIEREIHGCAAGLRTHILVCVGATLFMLTSISVAISHGSLGAVDPSRIAAGVVTGIGFLGAGAIIRYGASIRGLTTAASIWAVAAIGLATGAGMYAAAVLAAAVVLTVLILSRLEERMALKRHGQNLRVRVTLDSEIEADDLKNIIEAYGGKIKRVTSKKIEGQEKTDITIGLILARIYHKEILDEITSLPGVEETRWEK